MHHAAQHLAAGQGFGGRNTRQFSRDGRPVSTIRNGVKISGREDIEQLARYAMHDLPSTMKLMSL